MYNVNLVRERPWPLAGLIYASVHGLIDLQAGGRMRSEKGFEAADDGVDLLLKVLSRAR